ncbi:MAG TPA: phosphate regulon sensor histidine kinase PhoR, partial [Gammaproteobacteria bacterium]
APWGWVTACVAYAAWHAVQGARCLALLEGDIGPSPAQLPGAWRLLGTAIDARQRRARKRWRRKQRYHKRLAAAVAALPDAVVILDPHGCVEWCSPQAEPLLGLRWPEAAGKPLDELVASPELLELAAGELLGTPRRLASPVNANLVLSLRVELVRKRHRPRRLLLARDVTALHNLDRVRQDFIANVSHELRTPLTVLRGFLESMQGEHQALAEWAPAVASMATQAQRMQLLIDDLLTLSRIELGEHSAEQEVVAVPELLERLAAEARSLSGARGHVIALEAAPGLHLRGSERELQSAFANLVFNAVQHTPPRCRIRITWHAEEGGACFAVRDTGEGIPAEHLPRLTERFYRVDSSRSRDSGGTGLGLAIVKHVLRRHDSELEIGSKVGIGSSFGCRFPPARVVVVPG